MISKDSVSSSVQISSSKGQGVNIPVFIRSYPENKIRLPFRVTGSVFDETRQILYMLSTLSGSPKLETYNVSEGTFAQYNLNISGYTNNAGLCIMPDGEHLIINMGAMLYLFDVNEGTIVHSLQFYEYITNTTGSPNQKVYISTQNYDDTFYYLDVNTKELVSVNINTMYGHFIQTHPSWEYLYGMHHYNGLLKLNISSNPPTLIYSENQYDADKDTYFVLFTNSDYYNESRSLQMLSGSMDFIRVIEPEPFLINDGNGNYTSENAAVQKVFNNPANNTLIVITRIESNNYYDYNAIEIISY